MRLFAVSFLVQAQVWSCKYPFVVWNDVNRDFYLMFVVAV